MMYMYFKKQFFLSYAVKAMVRKGLESDNFELSGFQIILSLLYILRYT